MTYLGINSGYRMMAASLFKDAISVDDDEYLEADPIGSTINLLIQEYTCASYELLKKRIKEAYSLQKQKPAINPDKIAIDAKTMTIEQLAEKYDRPTQSIRNYLNRHNIAYVKVFSPELKVQKWNEIAKELKSLGGMYTIDELTHMKGRTFSGCNYTTLKNFCDDNLIPYKVRVVS